MRRTQRKNMDPVESVRYHAVAERLLETAQALRDLDDDTFANGLGIVAVHAAIAMCDAVTIRIGGCKSTIGEHDDAAALLASTVANVPDAAMRGLRDALQEKTRYSYVGRLVRMDDAGRLLAGVERFFTWARTQL